MRNAGLHTIAAFTVAFSLTACAREVRETPQMPAFTPPLGNCGPNNGLEFNVVSIYFDTQGKPQASPEVCRVTQGATIFWLMEGDRAGEFELEFKRGDCTPDGESKRTFKAKKKPRNNTHKTLIAQTKAHETGPGADNECKYNIKIGNQITDPSIIIDM